MQMRVKAKGSGRAEGEACAPATSWLWEDIAPLRREVGRVYMHVTDLCPKWLLLNGGGEWAARRRDPDV